MRVAAGALFFLLRTIVTIAVLWFVFGYYGIGRVVDIVGRLDLRWALVGLLIAVAQIFVLAWRWQLLCVVIAGATPRFSVLLFTFGRSLLVGQLLPATVGADAVRAIAIVSAIGAAGAARSVVCDRLLGLFALVLMVCIELPVFARHTVSDAAIHSLAVVSLIAVAGFLATLSFRRLLPQIPVLGHFATVVADDLWRALSQSRGRLSFALGFVAHAMSMIVFIAFVRSVDTGISPFVSGLVILPALLVVAAPISLGGWGVREASIASGFALLSADPVPALTASILFGLTGPIGGAAVELLALATHAHGIARSRPS